MKEKFEKEMRVKISLAMHAELRDIANQAGLYVNELVRNALHNELTRLKKNRSESHS